MSTSGECGYSIQADGKIDSTGDLCQTQSDCGDNVQCFSWENYLGVVHFDSRGVNVEGSYYLTQIYNNSDGIFNNYLIGPSTSSICKLGFRNLR